MEEVGAGCRPKWRRQHHGGLNAVAIREFQAGMRGDMMITNPSFVRLDVRCISGHAWLYNMLNFVENSSE